MSRTNTELKILKSRAEFEAIIDDIARMQIDQKRLEAERDKLSQEVLDKYNPDIIAFSDRITELQDVAMAYADKERDTLFGKGKSASCALAIYGFKSGNKQLVNISGKSDEIIAKELFDGKRTDCAEVSYSLNKNGIKTALKDAEDSVCGIFEFQRKERFFVEAKTDKEV